MQDRRIEVNDLMQTDYSYVLKEPSGNFFVPSDCRLIQGN